MIQGEANLLRIIKKKRQLFSENAIATQDYVTDRISNWSILKYNSRKTQIFNAMCKIRNGVTDRVEAHRRNRNVSDCFAVASPIDALWQIRLIEMFITEPIKF